MDGIIYIAVPKEAHIHNNNEANAFLRREKERFLDNRFTALQIELTDECPLISGFIDDSLIRHIIIISEGGAAAKGIALPQCRAHFRRIYK